MPRLKFTKFTEFTGASARPTHFASGDVSAVPYAFLTRC